MIQLTPNKPAPVKGVIEINISMAKSNKPRYGIFYKSHGKWTGPYDGVSFTKYTLNWRPIKYDVEWLRREVLKSLIQIRPVTVTK